MGIWFLWEKWAENNGAKTGKFKFRLCVPGGNYYEQLLNFHDFSCYFPNRKPVFGGKKKPQFFDDYFFMHIQWGLCTISGLKIVKNHFLELLAVIRNLTRRITKRRQS